MAAERVVSGGSSSRRSLLRAGLAGLAGAGLGTIGRPRAARAAAGDSLVLGAANNAGVTNTSLTTSTTGTALQINQNGTGTALRGVAGNGIAGFFTSANGSGISGVVANKDKFGVYGGNDAATTGTGAAIRAAGQQNHGVLATTTAQTRAAVKAIHAGTEANVGIAVLGLNHGHTEAEIGSPMTPAAGTFVGDVGVFARSANASTGVAVAGFASGPDAQGVAARSSGTGTTVGVSGDVSSPDGKGVVGWIGGPHGTGCAVQAAGNNNNGLVATTYDVHSYAVRAENTGDAEGLTGVAVLGLAAGATEADATNAVGAPVTAAFAGIVGVAGVSPEAFSVGTGVVGSSYGTSGIGVVGVANSSEAGGLPMGVYGQVYSPDGVAVKGESYASSGDAAYGVYGVNNSNVQTSAGVMGRANGDAACGVRGEAHGVGGYGVMGTSELGGSSEKGVMGYAGASEGVNYGVFGSTESATAGFGVYSWGNAGVHGNLNVTGNVSKAGGTFKIDHPLDPANKYLYHSFVESPDMKNVYDGTVTLDANGEATVTLPDWFEALNRDVRYQLTAVGRSAPDLFVRSKVKDGRFTIAGGAAGQEVCWLLTGIRKDAWAEAHRVRVEEAKPKDERGLYLHPVEHGQPVSKAIEARHAPKIVKRPAKKS